MSIRVPHRNGVQSLLREKNKHLALNNQYEKLRVAMKEMFGLDRIGVKVEFVGTYILHLACNGKNSLPWLKEIMCGFSPILSREY